MRSRPMGLFEVVREKQSETREKAQSAKSKAKGVTTVDALVEEAWASGDPKVVEPLYKSMAKKDPTVALALARIAAGENESNRALIEENAELVAPIYASWMNTDRAGQAYNMLLALRVKRSVPALVKQLETCKDKNHRPAILMALAGVAEGDTIDLVKRNIDPKSTFPAIGELVRRRHADMRGYAIDAIRAWLDGRKKKDRPHRDDAQQALYAIEVLGEGKAHEACDVLHEVVRTVPYSDHALRALARIGHESSREPAKELLSLLAGDEARNWPYALGARAILRALGENLTLDLPRAVLAHAHPRRYGYPKVDDWVWLTILAAREFLAAGEDVEKMTRYRNAPFKFLRNVGVDAWKKLHGTEPALHYYDEPRAKMAIKEEKPARILELIEDPSTVFRHTLVRDLAKTKDAKTKKAFIEVCVRELESRLNHRVDYYEDDDMGVDAHAFLSALEKMKKDAKKRIESSTSLWIQHHLLEKTITDWPEAPPPKGKFSAEVTRLGKRAGGGTFAVGKQINALALSSDGTKLAIAGDSHGMIVDAKSGDTIAELRPLEWNWAYDAVFSPDGTQLVVSYHGGHIVIFDGTTGEKIKSLDGHGGVPDGVKRVTLSPDGKTLLSCGSDGRAFLWSFPGGKKLHTFQYEKGSFEGAAFSKDGERFALAHVDPDFVLVGDVKSGKTQTIKTKKSMWAVCFLEDGTLVMGGDDKNIFFLDQKLKEKRKAAQNQVVRILSDGTGGIYALSQTGVLKHWNPKTNATKDLETGGGQMWALVRNAEGMLYTAGTRGVVERFDAKGDKLEGAQLVAHTNHVMGFALREDGGFFTAGWDGKLIAWSADGAAEKIVREVGERMSQIDQAPDKKRFLVLHGSGVLLYENGELLGHVKAKDPETCAISRDGSLAAIGWSNGHVKIFSLPAFEIVKEKNFGKAWDIESIAAYEDGWIVSCEDGMVRGISSDLEVLWTLEHHGRDLLEGEPLGNPHKNVMSIATRAGGWFMTAATDHTIRLYDPGRVQRKRFLTHSGLFNNVVFSPSGDRILSPSSWDVVLFDAKTGDTLCYIPRAGFPGVDEMTHAIFVTEDEALVGAENGNVYRVRFQ